ncbi:MAG: hypothetical protein ACKO6N_05770 [Myxococcota bacterium]
MPHWMPLSCFQLTTHTGPYEHWPSKTPLLRDGQPTGTSIQGYTLLHQLQHAAGFLLITDFDCPFEEAVCFTLLGPQLEQISVRVWGAPYASFWLDELFESAAGTLCCDLSGLYLELSLRAWHVPYLLPKLQFARLKESAYLQRRDEAVQRLHERIR